jgi:hypothetical protein
MDKITNENLYNKLHALVDCCNNPTGHCHGHNHDEYTCMATEEIHYNPCEFCKKVDTDPIDLNKCTDRLLKLKVTLKNVCFEKEISVGIILCDKCGKVIDFKVFTAILHKDCNHCCTKPCGTLTRFVRFNIPKSDVCCPLDLSARIVANYTSPCEPHKPICC